MHSDGASAMIIDYSGCEPRIEIHEMLIIIIKFNMFKTNVFNRRDNTTSVEYVYEFDINNNNDKNLS